MITDAQYDSLFAFCRKHYVQYYDVQVELVDHLASAIEARMLENPKLSFEQALDSVYAGFGIKGFADIVATRMQMVGEKCKKQKWQLFFSYFTVPKIAMTVCIYAGLLLIGKFLTQDYYRGLFLLLIGVVLFIFEIIHSIQASKLFKRQKKEMIYTNERLSGIISSGFFLQLFFSTRAFDLISPKHVNFIPYAIVSLLLLIIFISTLAHRDFIKALYNSAIKQYPNAFA